MTSHELARKLLQQEDVPVVLFDNEYDCYEEVTALNHVTTRYYDTNCNQQNKTKCIELSLQAVLALHEHLWYNPFNTAHSGLPAGYKVENFVLSVIYGGLKLDLWSCALHHHYGLVNRRCINVSST